MFQISTSKQYLEDGDGGLGHDGILVSADGDAAHLQASSEDLLLRPLGVVVRVVLKR